MFSKNALTLRLCGNNTKAKIIEVKKRLFKSSAMTLQKYPPTRLSIPPIQSPLSARERTARYTMPPAKISYLPRVRQSAILSRDRRFIRPLSGSRRNISYTPSVPSGWTASTAKRTFCAPVTRIRLRWLTS